MQAVQAGEVILLDAASVAEALPGRWWVPPPASLEELVPGMASVKVLAIEAGPDGVGDLWSSSPIWLDVEERSGEGLTGIISSSRLEVEGYRAGDRLMAPFDRIFDLVVVGADGEPLLNEDRARFAIGKRVLVGLTVLSTEGEPIEQRQLSGTVAGVVADRGIELHLDDGEVYWLPPDARSLEEARPGEYRLRSSGEVVRDPDYLCFWQISMSEQGYLPESGFQAPNSPPLAGE